MKRSDLEVKLQGIENAKEIIDFVMSENGKDIETLKATHKNELAKFEGIDISKIEDLKKFDPNIPNLAKRMKDITNKTLSESIRIARTETTRVENSAKQDVGEHGKKLGFKMRKQWISTGDSRTRPEHGEADRQIVDIDDRLS